MDNYLFHALVFKDLGTDRLVTVVTVFWVILWLSSWILRARIIKSKSIKNYKGFKNIVKLSSRKVKSILFSSVGFVSCSSSFGLSARGVGSCCHVWISPVTWWWSCPLSFPVFTRGAQLYQCPYVKFFQKRNKHMHNFIINPLLPLFQSKP